MKKVTSMKKIKVNHENNNVTHFYLFHTISSHITFTKQCADRLDFSKELDLIEKIPRGSKLLEPLERGSYCTEA